MNGYLLALYPRSWRERYGAEVAGLADELVEAGETTPLRAALGLIGGAAVERWRVLTSRAVLVPAAAAATVAGGLALVVIRAPHGAGATRPYFDSHPVGLLLLVVELLWLLMEAAELRRGRRSRYRQNPGTRKSQRRLILAIAGCVAGATVTVNLAPAAVPSAEIRPGALAFALGMLLMAAGLVLRGWSFVVLGGRYLNFCVVVRPDQPVVTTGPYRLLRHPGNAGLLLICTGIGCASANWAALAGQALLPLAVVVWRIRAEERTLLSAVGERYRDYASDRKRLVPLIW